MELRLWQLRLLPAEAQLGVRNCVLLDRQLEVRRD